MVAEDPLAALAALPGVTEACQAARDAVDAVLWDRGVRSRAAEIAAESALEGARDSAALDGVDVPLDRVRSGQAMDSSPMGRLVTAALAVTGEARGQVDMWGRAPLQALAHLHLVAARGFCDDDQLGRPRAGEPDDPLRMGGVPPASEVPPRLDLLARTVTAPTSAPAVLVAGVVHGELLTLRPFAWGSGLVARSAVRLVLAARGVDPDLLTVPEAGMVAQGRSSYVRSLRAFATGSPEGVAEWLVWNARAIELGARRVL